MARALLALLLALPASADETLPAGAGGPPQSRVLFAARGGLLIPLACFDGPARRLRGGMSCAPLVRVGATVKLQSGALATIFARTGVTCGRGEVDPVPAFAIPHEQSRPDDDWAVWPPEAWGRISASDRMPPLTPEARKWLELRRASTLVPMQLDDSGRVELMSISGPRRSRRFRVLATDPLDLLGGWSCDAR